MTTLDTIRDAIPDYARDLKLNLGSVLTTSGAPGLTDKQIWAVALASAIASRNAAVHSRHRVAGCGPPGCRLCKRRTRRSRPSWA